MYTEANEVFIKVTKLKIALKDVLFCFFSQGYKEESTF